MERGTQRRISCHECSSSAATARSRFVSPPLLAERGDHVGAAIRNPDHAADVTATGAQPVLLDIEKLGSEDAVAALQGYDAVVWSAGAGGGDPRRTYAIDRDAATRWMDAAAEVGGVRFVMVSWLGSHADHGVPEDNAFFPYADAKWAADEHLRATDLAWTIVAPGTLTLDEPTGRITLDPSGRGEVTRGDVAAVIAAVLADDATVGRTLRFGNGDQPIADALAAPTDED